MHAFDRWTDRDTFLVASPCLHYMQHGKNKGKKRVHDIGSSFIQVEAFLAVEFITSLFRCKLLMVVYYRISC